MKYLMFLLFTAINLAIVLKIPEGDLKFRYLKLMGITIPIVLVVAGVILILIKASGVVPDLQFKHNFFSLLLSVLAVLLVNCIIIVGIYMVDSILGFHNVNNTANLERFPIRFVVKHHQSIKTGIKAFFFLGSILMFYGVWLSRPN